MWQMAEMWCANNDRTEVPERRCRLVTDACHCLPGLLRLADREILVGNGHVKAVVPWCPAVPTFTVGSSDFACDRVSLVKYVGAERIRGRSDSPLPGLQGVTDDVVPRYELYRLGLGALETPRKPATRMCRWTVLI